MSLRLLLDTHALIWWFENNPKLPKKVRSAIADGANVIYVSAATAWEIAIKQSLGKLRIPTDLEDRLRRAEFQSLPITMDHAFAAGLLPLHHDDPFDRMLVAQSRLEGLTLATGDSRLADYGVGVLWKD